MEPLSGAVGILTVSLAKRLGHELLASVFEDPNSPTRSLLEEALKDGSGKLAAPLATALDGLSMKASVRREIEGRPTIFDLAGIAWGQELSSWNDTDFGHLGVAAGQVRRSLSPRWLVSALLTGPEFSLATDFGRWEPLKSLSPPFAERMVQYLCLEALDELGLTTAPDELIFSLFRRAIQALPRRIETLFLALPGTNEVLARIAAESAREEAQGARESAKATERIVTEMVGHLDGSVLADRAKRAMRKIAEIAASLLEQDVFRRRNASADEFELLPLRTTYVEPEGQNRLGHVAPVMGLLRRALFEKPADMVVVVAPFGYGKSLTVKTLAAALAEEWRNNPEDVPLPLFIHAPEAFLSNARTPEEAVRLHLENCMNLESETASWIWRETKLVIILDSFDEVVLEQKDARNWIWMLQKVARDGQHRVLVASRDHAVEPMWLKRGSEIVQIRPFDRSRIDKWLRATAGKVHDGSLDAGQVIAWLGEDLAGTPILLLMAAWDWHASEATRSLSRTQLYARFVARIARGKWAGVQEVHPVVHDGASVLDALHGAGSYEKALGLIAWTHRINEGRRASGYVLPVRDVEVILQREFRASNGSALQPAHLSMVYKSIVLSVFVRRSEDDQGILFAHKSFREFLCACHLVLQLQDAGRSPYVHPGMIALAQVELGPEELSFAGDLIRDLPPETRQQVVALLDQLRDNAKRVLFKNPGNLEILHDNHQEEVVVCSASAIRSGESLLPGNAELLALHVRNMDRVRRVVARQAIRHSASRVGNFRILGLISETPLIAYRTKVADDRFYALLTKSELSTLSGGEFAASCEEDEDFVAFPMPEAFHLLGSGFRFSVGRPEPLTGAELLEIGRLLLKKANAGLSCDTELVAWKRSDESWSFWPMFHTASEAAEEKMLRIWRASIRQYLRSQRTGSFLLDSKVFHDAATMRVLAALSEFSWFAGQISFSEMLRGFERISKNLIRVT